MALQEVGFAGDQAASAPTAAPGLSERAARLLLSFTPLGALVRIRTAQDEVMATVADVANLVRDGKTDEAMQLQLKAGYPLFRQVEGFVEQVVRIEEDGMARQRDATMLANTRALYLMGGLV